MGNVGDELFFFLIMLFHEFSILAELIYIIYLCESIIHFYKSVVYFKFSLANFYVYPDSFYN